MNSLHSISPVRNSDNLARKDIPPTRPADLFKLSGREFSMLIITQKDRLLESWAPSKIEIMEEEFRKFKQYIKKITMY